MSEDTTNGEAQATTLSTLSPENRDHVTMAATVDVEELSPPRVNWVLDQAAKYEQQFITYLEADGVDACGRDEASEPLGQLDCEKVSMSVTADVRNLSTERVASLVEKATELEDRLHADVQKAREKAQTDN